MDDHDLQTDTWVEMDDHDLQTYPQVQTDDHDLQWQTLRYEWSWNYKSNKTAKFRQLAGCHLLLWFSLHFHLKVCLCKPLSPSLTNRCITFMHQNNWPHNWLPEQPTKKQESNELTYFYKYIHTHNIYIYIYTHTHTHTHTQLEQTNK
jgi:hypothetical protein